MATISDEQRRWRLARRHFLAAPASSVEQIAGDLAGLHSSDPVTVYLSCRARMQSFGQTDLDTALYQERTLLRLHGMRRTLFVVPPDLAGVMTAGCTSTYVEPQRKRLVGFLETGGITDDGETWLHEVESDTLEALERLGESTATELREVVPALKLKIPFGQSKKWGGQVGVSTRVLFLLATAGHIVRTRPLGTWISSQYRWDLLERWCREGMSLPDPTDARADLATRWLRAFGPGTLEDIKWWTGWGVGVTRQALSDCGAVAVDLIDGTGFVMPDDLDDVPEPDEWVALLPSLDPTVMGWKSRDWYLGGHAGDLFDRNGNAGPTVWANGRVIGGWAQMEDGEIRVEPLEPVAAEIWAMVNEEADRLGEWFGDSRITPRFRTPLEKRFLG